MILDHGKIQRIKNALKFRPKGMSISEIAKQLQMNRNSVAKYLEILLMSGEVEAKAYGTSKVYALSQRVPVSAMMDFSSDMIVMVDSDQRIVQVNDRLLRFTDVKRETLIGKQIGESGIAFVQDLPLDRVLKESKEKEVAAIERQDRHQDGDAYFSIKLVSTIFDDGNEGVTIIIEDITDQKKAQTALVEREKLYRSVIDNVQDVFYRSDRNGNLIMASPSWAGMLGYDLLDECLGKDIAETFYMEPERRREFREAVYAKGSVSDYEVVLKKKDGTPLYVSTNSHLYYDESGSVLGIEGIFRDVSERRAAAKKIQDYIGQIEFLSQKLLEFIELAPEFDIYEKICRDLKLLVPDAMIAVNSYDHETGIVTIRCLLGETDRASCGYCLGRDPIGLELPIDPVALNSLITGRLNKIPYSLYDITFRAIPEEICDRITETIGFDEAYAVGFSQGGRLFGNATILPYRRSEIGDLHLIETYVRQASIALQRRITEKELVEKEEMFVSVTKQSPFPIAITDRIGNFQYINPSFSDVFGYDLGDFHTEREWFMLIFPDSGYRKRAVSNWEEDQANNLHPATAPRHYRVRCKDGSEKDVLIRVVSLSSGDECIICDDITERKKAWQAKKLLASIIESTDDAIIGKDKGGTIISWNRAAARLYGYTQDEIIGRHISLIIPPERRNEMEEILGRIREGESVNNLETLRIRKDGGLIEVSVTISPIMDEDGSVIGASTIARDISAHKAEERLKESEEKYRALVDNIAVGVYRSTGDPRGRFVWGNPSLVRILGYSSLDTLKTIDVADIFAEEDGRERLLEELQRSGFVKNREITLKRPDGKPVYVSVTALARFDKKGDLICINGLVEDITGHRQARSDLLVMHKEILDIIEFIPDPTFVVDTEGKVIAWNAAIESLTGVKKTGVIGRSDYAYALSFSDKSRPILIDLIDAPDDHLARYYETLRREGSTLEAEVFAPALKEGRGAFLWLKASPLIDPDGNRMGAIETIRDISDLHRLKAGTIPDQSIPAIQAGPRVAGIAGSPAGSPGQTTPVLQNLLYLSSALNNAPDGITILDLSARCLWANNALVSLLGAEKSDAIVGRSVAQYIATEFRKITLDRLSEVRRNGHASFPLSLITPGGRIPVEAGVSIVGNEAGEILGFMAIMRRVNNSPPEKSVRKSSVRQGVFPEKEPKK